MAQACEVAVWTQEAKSSEEHQISKTQKTPEALMVLPNPPLICNRAFLAPIAHKPWVLAKQVIQ